MLSHPLQGSAPAVVERTFGSIATGMPDVAKWSKTFRWPPRMRRRGPPWRFFPPHTPDLIYFFIFVATMIIIISAFRGKRPKVCVCAFVSFFMHVCLNVCPSVQLHSVSNFQRPCHPGTNSMAGASVGFRVSGEAPAAAPACHAPR